MIVYRELSSLERDLGIQARTLYAVSNDLDRHYRRVSLPKKGGRTRQLAVPDEVLKHIQRRITQVLLIRMPVSPWATAYRCGGGTLVNAIPHTDQPMVLTLDIQRFFDSILYSAVKEWAFPAEIYAEPLRILLAMLCYYRDVLPQGAPSSPAITNVILREFDREVGSWCRERDVRYTRYCDDMTFSGAFDPTEVKAFVAGQLRHQGFFLNEKKTRLARQGQRQQVTGLVVNQRTAVPAQYRRGLRQELHFCQKFGVASHLERLGLTGTPEAYLQTLLGRVNYVLQITPGNREMEEYRTWLQDQCRKKTCHP